MYADAMAYDAQMENEKMSRRIVALEQEVCYLKECLGDKMKMKLRYFITYDENGVDSEKELQYYDEGWVTINTIRVSEKDEDRYDPEYY